jgi:hypothetical protein
LAGLQVRVPIDSRAEGVNSIGGGEEVIDHGMNDLVLLIDELSHELADVQLAGEIAPETPSEGEKVRSWAWTNQCLLESEAHRCFIGNDCGGGREQHGRCQ